MEIKARKLLTKDVFKLARIIKKAGIKKEMAEFAVKLTGNKEKKNIEEIGLEFILLLIEAASDVEKELYDFLGDVSGLSGADIAELPVTELGDIFKEIAAVNNLGSFFTLAFSSLK